MARRSDGSVIARFAPTTEPLDPSVLAAVDAAVGLTSPLVRRRCASVEVMTTRILVVGGGYVGMYAALRLGRRLHEGEATVTVVDPRSYMTYQPFLPEAGAGSSSARHTVVLLRQTLRRTEVVTAWVEASTTAQGRAGAPDRGRGVRDPVRRAAHGRRLGAAHAADPGLADWATGLRTSRRPSRCATRGLESLDIAEGATDPRSASGR